LGTAVKAVPVIIVGFALGLAADRVLSNDDGQPAGQTTQIVPVEIVEEPVTNPVIMGPGAQTQTDTATQQEPANTTSEAPVAPASGQQTQQQAAPAAPSSGGTQQIGATSGTLSGRHTATWSVIRNQGNHPVLPVTSVQVDVVLRPGSQDDIDIYVTLPNNVRLQGAAKLGQGFSSQGGRFRATAGAPYQGFQTTYVAEGEIAPGRVSFDLTIGGMGLPGSQPLIEHIEGTR
jgi:hypothetical protein